METTFFELLDKATSQYQSITFEITWDKWTDWCISIKHNQSNTIIYEGQKSLKEQLFAEAYLALLNWFIDKNGGY